MSVPHHPPSSMACERASKQASVGWNRLISMLVCSSPALGVCANPSMEGEVLGVGTDWYGCLIIARYTTAMAFRAILLGY